MVSDFNDTTSPGTLRHALTNAQDGDIIRFSGITPGLTAIELASALPEVSKSVIIEGNGITLKRSDSWTTVDSYSQLLRVHKDNFTIRVNISRIHFKDVRPGLSNRIGE
jgi:hypothetical protein